MKKIILSTVAIATMSLSGAYADTSSDIAAMKAMMQEMSKRLAKLEQENIQLKANQKKQAKEVKQAKAEIKKVTPKNTKRKAIAKADVTNEETAAHVEKFAKATVVKSKVPVLKFSGKHYLGFVHNKESHEDSTNRFETRRNYFQVKGYFGEHSKDYFRITLDTFQNVDKNEFKPKDSGSWEVRLKYAFLYLDEILPFTGIEIGQAHRPWIDFEEHGGWNYRSISKVFVEASNGAHLTNSADLGFNLKTKTEYFSSELGVYNGEGYHDIEDGKGLSGEWRLTGHILGTGKEKRKNNSTYADVSFLGQWNDNSAKHGHQSLDWYGLHGVYNQPEFLLAGQYVNTVKAADGFDILGNPTKNFSGSGYSFNGEYRFMHDWKVIARYDNWKLDNNFFGDQKTTIAGVTYKYNKYVEFIANYLGENNTKDTDINQDAFMLTAEVNW
jgi:hypothetical protein